MASINLIKASDGTGNASTATVQTVRNSGVTTIIVDTVNNIPATFMGSMGTPHTFVDPVTSEEITVISEATAVDFTGHVDGGNLEIDTIAPGYTDAGSEVGDIVIIRPTTQWSDELADILEVAHNDDGTLKNNAVTTAVIADDAVTADKIDEGAVGATQLSDTAIYLADGGQSGSMGSLSTTEVAITNMTITFTVPAGGRKVLVQAKGSIQNTASQTTIMRLRKTNISGTVVDSDSIYIAGATASEGYVMWSVETLTAGTYTYIVTTQQASGTGTATIGKMLATLI